MREPIVTVDVDEPTARVLEGIERDTGRAASQIVRILILEGFEAKTGLQFDNLVQLRRPRASVCRRRRGASGLDFQFTCAIPREAIREIEAWAERSRKRLHPALRELLELGLARQAHTPAQAPSAPAPA
ncbi:MAG: hypothetical protein ACREHV_17475 [Rhizomicrobium sp.]